MSIGDWRYEAYVICMSYTKAGLQVFGHGINYLGTTNHTGVGMCSAVQVSELVVVTS
jgi:hypothetical protein